MSAAGATAVLQRAVAAHRAGHLAEARAGYDEVLADDPHHGWANYFRSLIADDDEDEDLALACLRRATASSAPPVQAFVALGNRELRRGAAQAALAAFEAAARLQPALAAAFTGKALALKRLDRLADAAAAGRQALVLRRGWRPGMAGPPGRLDPSEIAEMRRVNRVKLAHDAAQLRYLHARGIPGIDAARLADLHERLSAGLPEAADDMALSVLDDSAFAASDHAYNQLLHLPDADVPPGGALAPGTDFASADRAFAQRRPQPIVIDDVLAPDALKRLQDFCREATIWFEVKDHGGHLGAYFEEGLACPLLVETSAALRRVLPQSLGNLQLAQLWAYKHMQGGSGTDLHADIGAVSANLWLAPDAASLDDRGGGIEIWPQRLPADWDFRRANVERDGIRALLARTGATPVVIPHRCNRLVLFEANLFHRTSPGRFAAGYENRRVNITFLYDRPSAGFSKGH